MLRSRRRRNRVVAAVALALALFFADSGARLVLVLRAPHLAPLVIPAERSNFTGYLSPDGYGVDNDYAGVMYHIRDNVRLTIGQPEYYTRTVWIFGNSGAFGLYVADADTMESRLQTLLNASGYRWRVVNAAIPGDAVAAEYARLRDTLLRTGDVIVFDDGAMDLVYGRCDDSRYAVLQLYCQLTLDNSGAVANYNRVVAEAQAYATARGATFYHFLQPTPYPQYERGADGWRLSVPYILIMDAYHLTVEGEKVEADQIFDVLTRI